MTRYLRAADCGEVYTSDNDALGTAEDTAVAEAAAADVVAVVAVDVAVVTAAADELLPSLPAPGTVSTHAK